MACRDSSMSYEAADGGELPLLVFEPAEGTPLAAGIVLFRGGAPRTGSADGLAPHCRRLASRGILAVSAGYRLLVAAMTAPGGPATARFLLGRIAVS